jgi:hypothetical protein
VETTSVGLLPHSQLYNRVPLAPGRYRVSVRRAGEAFGDIGFLSVRWLEDREVPVELPGRDLDAVVLPLLALDLDVAVEDVLAERAQDEL